MQRVNWAWGFSLFVYVAVGHVGRWAALLLPSLFTSALLLLKDGKGSSGSSVLFYLKNAEGAMAQPRGPSWGLLRLLTGFVSLRPWSVSLGPSWAGGVPRHRLQHGMRRRSVPGLFSTETQLSRASLVVLEVPALAPPPRCQHRPGAVPGEPELRLRKAPSTP